MTTHNDHAPEPRITLRPLSEAPKDADEILLVSFQEQGPNGLVYITISNGCWDAEEESWVLGPRGCRTNCCGDGVATHWLPAGALSSVCRSLTAVQPSTAPTPDGDKLIQRAIGRQEGHDQCRKEVLAALDSGIPRQPVIAPSAATNGEPSADRETLAQVFEDFCHELGVSNNEDALLAIRRLKSVATEAEIREIYSDEDDDPTEPMPEVIATHDGEWRREAYYWRFHDYPETPAVHVVTIADPRNDRLPTEVK